MHAISGTHVVLLGFDSTTKKARKGLLGFAVHRKDHTEDEEYWIRGFRTFEMAENSGLKPGQLVSTLEHPVQSYSWGDYTAKPNHIYTYTVVPMYGESGNLRKGSSVKVKIKTHCEDECGIYFNRGVAGSQAYARRFDNVRPSEIKDKKKQKAAYKWLSRGLEEAILAFIDQAKNSNFALRAAVYEFSHLPVLEAFGTAARKKADVKIVYDRRKRGPFEATEKATRKAGIRKLMIPRKVGSAISHNKFIVLLEKGEPVAVWTGSTNFTAAGIFGQSNVGQVIRDKGIAKQYFDYWTRLSEDPTNKELRPLNVEATPDPVGPIRKKGTIKPLFSPRNDLTALEWYGERLAAAKQSVCFTAAFGISATLAGPLLKKKDYLRFIMVETQGSKRAKKPTPENPKPKSQFDVFQDIRKVKNNEIAIGAILREANDAAGDDLHHWLRESLTGLNTHVKYLHTKYMFLDALTNNPTVISGSANFSSASTTSNDENMVIIQGDTDLADIFLGEFMRLFHHFYFRQFANRAARKKSGKSVDKSPHLRSDDSWTERFFDSKSIKSLERKFFA